MAFQLPQGVHGWSTNRLKWAIDESILDLTSPPDFSLLVNAAFEWASDEWASVCDITFCRCGYDDDPHILVCANPPITGIAAHSEIPNRTTKQVHCWIDPRRDWAFAGKGSSYVKAIDLGIVLRHECGHLIGLGHDDIGNVMAAVYDARIRTLQKRDVMEARIRYGDAPVRIEGVKVAEITKWDFKSGDGK